jgi:hypothetical protein
MWCKETNYLDALRGEADLVFDLDLDLDLDLETDRSNDLLHKTDSYHFMVE